MNWAKIAYKGIAGMVKEGRKEYRNAREERLKKMEKEIKMEKKEKKIGEYYLEKIPKVKYL